VSDYCEWLKNQRPDDKALDELKQDADHFLKFLDQDTDGLISIEKEEANGEHYLLTSAKLNFFCKSALTSAYNIAYLWRRDQKRNLQLRHKIEHLETKVSALESENTRLKTKVYN